MKYRFLDWGTKCGSKWEKDPDFRSPDTVALKISNLDPEERVDDCNLAPSKFFWHAPETIPVNKAVEMFVDSEIDRISKDIEYSNLLIQGLLRAKKEYYKNSPD